jgi:hypothetical protein
MSGSSTLEARVLALERGQRWLISACVALAACLAVSVCLRMLWVPREVSARRFMLKDADGRVRGEWGPQEVTAGEIGGTPQHASRTCLQLVGQKAADIHLCAPWDPYGGPSLVMREETGASLHVVLDAYTVSILARATRDDKTNRGRLVLGAWRDGGSLNVTDKEGRRTLVRGEGLTVSDSSRAAVYNTPGAGTSDR